MVFRCFRSHDEFSELAGAQPIGSLIPVFAEEALSLTNFFEGVQVAFDQLD
ncbi:MAG: hypothetical protein M1319_07275 [Chloroflexi bacterium]|nr:hypothetical protein [Chloroflexota bacterium]